MTKRLDRNGSTGASQCKYAFVVEANWLKLFFFEQSAVILPAFL